MDNLKSAMAEPPAAPRGVPLDLAPLLQPYLRHGHLSLKVERLPSGARFSRGSNNADRTWSLTLNDIKGLLYIPPKGMDKPHTLSVRVLSLEEDYGATLALLDVQVSPANAVRLDDEAELARLRDEVAAKQAALVERENALAQQRGGAPGASRQQIEAAIAAARKVWEAELQKRLAEAAAAASAELERSRAAWHSEQEGRRAAASARAQEAVDKSRERTRQEVEAALAKAQQGWKSAEAARLAAAEAKWRQETEAAMAAATEKLRQAAEAQAASQAKAARERGDSAELARLREELASKQTALAKAEGAKAEIESAFKQAEESWKAAEARRQQDAAQAAGQAAERVKQIEAALAEAQKELKAARERAADPAELKKLREAVAAKDATLAKQEKELEALGAAAQKSAEKARDFAKQELQAALKKAEESWKSVEAQRMAAAEARRGEEAQAAAEAAARADAARGKLEAEIKALRAAAEKAKEDAKSELAAAVKRAEDGAKSAEAAKLAATEARVREELEPALAEAKSRAGRAEAALAERGKESKGGRKGDEAEAKRLRDELAANQALLAERDKALAEARAALDHEKGQHQQALWQAESAWRAEEAERVAAAEARFRDQSRQAITEATERFERAEAELKEERALARTVHNRGDDAEIRRLKDELAAIHTKLDQSDLALSEARNVAADAEARAAAESEAARAKLEEAQKAAAAAPRLTADPAEHDPSKAGKRRDGMRGRFANAIARQHHKQILRYGVRGGVAAAVLAGAVIVYPRAEAMVAKRWWPKVVTVTSSIKSISLFSGSTDEPAPPPVAKAEPAIPERRTVIAAASANVRNGPSPDAGVIATLLRGEEVSPVDHRGIWVQIRFGGDDVQHRQEGWVFGSLLKDEPAR